MASCDDEALGLMDAGFCPLKIRNDAFSLPEASFSSSFIFLFFFSLYDYIKSTNKFVEKIVKTIIMIYMER